MTRLLFLTGMASCLAWVHATPKFNTVNGWDLNGNKCPLPSYNAYPCPTLCVRNIASCPLSIRPSCPAGQTYCVDGTCQSSCSASLVSACACASETSLQGNVYPCLTLTVTIKDFDAMNKTEQGLATCQQTVQAGNASIQSVTPWTSNPPASDQTPMWNTCPVAVLPPIRFTEPVYMTIYIFYGSCIVNLILWALYKQFRERSIKDEVGQKRQAFDDAPLEKNEKVSSKEQDEGMDDDQDMNIKAYRRDFVGYLALSIFLLQTLGHVGLMIMLTKDYYDNYALFNGDALIASSTFIGMWYLLFGWFASITLFRSRISNFFRLRCLYKDGQYVQVEAKQEGAGKQWNTMVFMEARADVVMRFAQFVEQRLKALIGSDLAVTTTKLVRTKEGTSYFVYQCTRFIYHEESGYFLTHSIDLGSRHSDLAKLTSGLTTDEAQARQVLVGPNFISVYVPNVFMAFVREFTSFFYTYQFTVLWLFYYFAYWQVGIADTAVILISAMIKVVVRLRSEKRIKKMAESTDTVMILRDGQWKEMSTDHLLPGDVIQLVQGKVTPCDGVILAGNVVVDESSLTGEPLPIRKFPLRREDDTVYDRTGGTGKISTIFAGTTVAQVQPAPHEEHVLALVTHTGTATDKGRLIKKILFPTHVSFIFDEQLKIVILILLACALIVLGLAIWLYATGTSAWFYAMFAICQLISPLLPAALVVGQSVAAGRLRNKQIYCVDLPRILMAGKVQIFCFDKTGTLTKEGLEFYGAQGAKDAQFDMMQEKVGDLPDLMQMAMASCHSVTQLHGQWIGNPVDIEMFKASQWQLEASDDYVDTLQAPSGSSLQTVHVLKRFEFVHARMSMSVAVLDTATNKVHVFVKGAYEKIKELSSKTSIPANYDTVTADMARHGCYVLAVAHREIDLGAIDGGKDAFMQWDREQLEQDVDLLGLLLFKNQLKADTTENISKLKQGATRTVMITGDTALTGVYIARQCGMTQQPNGKVLLGDLVTNSDEKKNGGAIGPRVVWTDVDEPETFDDVDVDQYLKNKAHTPVELAVTGKAFDWLVDHDLMRQYLLDTRVFARMTPHGKVQCIKLHMERGITAMTGDGGNDCGALRAAHVGIAMSDAEASIVSPFSTSVRSVKSCVELLRQGRAALATSITGYKYLILYGQVMMMLKIFTFYFSISMSQNIWIAVDVFITVLLTIAVSQSQAADELTPHRPTAKILGPQILASAMGVVLINWLFLIGGYIMLFQQPWFRCNEFDSAAVDISKWWLLSDNYEGALLSLMCVFQFINNAALQNWGYHFRKSFYRNYSLMFLLALYFACASYWCLAEPNRFGCLFRYNCGTADVLAQQLHYPMPDYYIEPYNTPLGHNVFPQAFRWKLWGLILGNIATTHVWERFVVLGPVHAYLAKRYPVRRTKMIF
ncbi:hypothetical protein BC940DRAFT_343132 [Gongronella butleri]|nr:hypothetical protein BC940DRAFT_343132 [Gongronella butleri]